MKHQESISIKKDELNRRVQQVKQGDSLDTVSNTLGGKPYQQEGQKTGKRRAYWRFQVTDKDQDMQPYEIYRGEFNHDQLESGVILPHG